MRLHASCVYWPRGGVLIRGAPGQGKSDLAWRLMAEAEAQFIGDDQIKLHLSDGFLMARPCVPGLLEVRGLGLVRVPFRDQGEVKLVIDLTDDMPRMPEPRFERFLGISLPCLSLLSFDVNAVRRIHLALHTIGQNGFPDDGIIEFDDPSGIASTALKGHSANNKE